MSCFHSSISPLLRTELMFGTPFVYKHCTPDGVKTVSLTVLMGAHLPASPSAKLYWQYVTELSSAVLLPECGKAS